MIPNKGTLAPISSQELQEQHIFLAAKGRRGREVLVAITMKVNFSVHLSSLGLFISSEVIKWVQSEEGTIERFRFTFTSTTDSCHSVRFRVYSYYVGSAI